MARDCDILHITDCHLLGDPRARLHGWPVAAAFEHVLAEALGRYPDADAIVLGGDLVDDESTAGYRWLDRRLAATGKPVLAMAGNHDAPQAMRRLLGSATVHGVLTLGGWRLIGLCSHRPDREDGRIGETALADLDACLTADRSPSLIGVHHPPFAVGSAWIDGIGLIDGPSLCTVLSRHEHVRGVLCGHVHQQSRHALARCEGWTTPSTMRQFRPGSADFAEDTERVAGYRWLRLSADGPIATEVHRCMNAPGPDSRA